MLSRSSPRVVVVFSAVLMACSEAQSPMGVLETAEATSSGVRVQAPAFVNPKVMNTLTTDLGVLGSEMAAAGIGLDGETEGTIVLELPQQILVRSAYLYWGGRWDDADASMINVEFGGADFDVVGDYIGLSVLALGEADSYSYRVNLLNYPFLFGPGTNTVDVTVPADLGIDGATLVVTYDSDSQGSVELRDGNDFAYLPFDAPNDATDLQTFDVAPADVDRVGTMLMIVGDVVNARPSRIVIDGGAGPVSLVNELGEGGSGWNGSEWDTYFAPVTIPAGSDLVSVQLYSHDDGTGTEPASLYWVLGALAVKDPERRQGGEGCTPGYWKQDHHFDSWPAPYMPGTLFSAVFDDAFPGMTLADVASQGGGQLKALGRHTVAALLNGASSGVSYDLSDGDVIAAFNDAYPGTNGEYEALKNQFEAYNEQGCPLN
ncbi:MAG: hypothetical protein HKO53_06585 [Gemmatimonadetes bacterium]|nr:hypothetical protein [Gemmatimonadota bacterium]